MPDSPAPKTQRTQRSTQTPTNPSPGFTRQQIGFLFDILVESANWGEAVRQMNAATEGQPAKRGYNVKAHWTGPLRKRLLEMYPEA